MNTLESHGYIFWKKNKDVPKTTTQFLKCIINCFNGNIKFFKTDNSLEFKNNDFITNIIKNIIIF